MSAALIDPSTIRAVADVLSGPPGPLQLVHALCCVCEDDNAEPCAVGEDFEYRTSPDTFVAMRCKDCGLICPVWKVLMTSRVCRSIISTSRFRNDNTTPNAGIGTTHRTRLFSAG